MTRPSTPPILAELRSASSPTSQLQALRKLKHEVIGHEQKKQAWVESGVLAPLVRILNSYKGDGKRKARSLGTGIDRQWAKESRTEEEEARLQAVIIVGSLAHG